MMNIEHYRSGSYKNSAIKGLIVTFYTSQVIYDRIRMGNMMYVYF
jgi:hypothetical protein